MDIVVKGRHTGVRERFRRYVTAKLGRIEKLDHKVVRADVEVSKERNPKLARLRERVELTVRSRGSVIRAEASADDRFSAFDIALDRLEARLRKLCDRRKVHRGAHTPVSVAAATAGLTGGTGPVSGGPVESAGAAREEPGEQEADEASETLETDESAESAVPLPTQGGHPLVVREKFHKAEPMTLDRALFEMELVGHDFYLFRDRDSGVPSVVYRRRGYDYGVLRLVEGSDRPHA